MGVGRDMVAEISARGAAASGWEFDARTRRALGLGMIVAAEVSASRAAGADWGMDRVAATGARTGRAAAAGMCLRRCTVNWLFVGNALGQNEH